MKPTLSDIAFWYEKRAPEFAKALLARTRERQPWHRPDSLIHDVINSHAGLRPTRYEMSAGNLLSILRSRRKRNENLRMYLAQMAKEPGTVIAPERRAGYALKWLKGIRRTDLAPKGQEMETTEHTGIYDELVAAGVQVDNHYSDLYVPVNAITRPIVERYQFRKQVSIFTNSGDGAPWYDIPFAYKPFWEARSAVRATRPRQSRHKGE